MEQKKFEYIKVKISFEKSSYKPHLLIDKLNEYGRLGWELVQAGAISYINKRLDKNRITTWDCNWDCYFKREINGKV